jgi:hypothetical protein
MPICGIVPPDPLGPRLSPKAIFDGAGKRIGRPARSSAAGMAVGNNLRMELNNFTAPSSYSYGSAQMPSKEARDRRVTHGKPQPVSPRDLFFDRRIARGLGSCDHGVLRAAACWRPLSRAPLPPIFRLTLRARRRRGQSPAFHVRTRRAFLWKCVAIIRSAVTPGAAAPIVEGPSSQM